MKKIDLKLKRENHFIGAWQLDDTELCNEVINFFNLTFNNDSKYSSSAMEPLVIAPPTIKET